MAGASEPRSAPVPAPEPQASKATRWTPVLLVRAAHPGPALLTAAGLAAAAGVSGRPAREVALVAITVVVGQVLLGWADDLADETPDRADERTAKPLVAGTLDRGTLGFALACSALLVVPLALSSGIDAGLAYLLSLAAALVGDRLLGAGRWSWLPWAISFALYPAYLSYGGWGGAADGHPPTVAMTVAAACLGIGVHVLRSLSGLVDDNRAGRRTLPLLLALRVGAPRLRVLAGLYCAVVTVAILVVGATSGLSR